MTCYIPLDLDFKIKSSIFLSNIKRKSISNKKLKTIFGFVYNDENKTGRNTDNINSKNQENVMVIPKRKFTFFKNVKARI